MNNMKRYTRSHGIPIICALLVISMCKCSGIYQSSEQTNIRLTQEVVAAWNHLLLDLERYTPGYRPPVSARMYAYVAAAAYESALPALAGRPSLTTRYASFSALRMPTWHEGEFVLPAALNHSYAYMARHFFPTAPYEWQTRIDMLEKKYLAKAAQYASTAAIDASIAYARQVSTVVWEWSTTDEAGHDGFLFNYDRNYKTPDCQGCWQATGERPMPSLLPHWGNVRPFIINPNDIKSRPPLQYDETPGSPYYKQSLEVFSLSQPYSKENIWIAEFWSDDLPGLTMSPVGRWISITNQAIECQTLTVPEILETYLLCSIALCDAAILCWKLKYEYHVERPESYVSRVIKNGWHPLHGSPSFPAYPSGHSIFGSAVAEVLTAQFGEPFSFTDRTHEGREEFEGTPRHFDSFRAMAQENAFSRLVLGVHYRMDCEEGLRLGKIVGQKVAMLRFSPEANHEISKR